MRIARIKPAAADAGGGVDLVEHLRGRPLVQRRLFDREIAEDLHLDLLGKIGSDLRIGLRPAQHKRANHLAEMLAAILVEQLFDRDGEALAEFAGAAKQAGVEHVHDRPELGEMVLDRRAGERDAARGNKRPNGDARGGGWILDLLRFIEGDAVPVDLRELVLIAMGQCVAGDDDIMPGGGVGEDFAAHALRAVMEEDLEVWRESLELAHPVADDGGRRE